MTLGQLRSWLAEELADREIEASPQVLNALVESVRRSPAAAVGDTDSILVGLLYSGSYTVDVLELSGVNVRNLRRAVARGIMEVGFDDQVPSESVFSSGGELGKCLENARGTGRTVETADLLRAALALGEGQAETPLVDQLEDKASDVLDEVLELFDIDASRRRGLSREEREHLKTYLSGDSPDPWGTPLMLQEIELDVFVQAADTWLRSHRLVTDPPDVWLRIIDSFEPGLLFGAQHFAAAGGNVKTLESAIALAARIAPERDGSELVLFERDGRFHLGQYTYRNSFDVEHPRTGLRPSHLQLHALRPASLLATSTIEVFEQLISQEHITEHQIQAFLERHPEFLQALGYRRAHPHLLLSGPGEPLRIPDFVLELPAARGFDLLDLKLPTARVAIEHPYVRISAEVTKAVAQLRAYRNFFDNASNRREFERRYGLEAFRPELIVVIGRSAEFASREARMQVEEQAGIRLLTYDDLLDYGRTRAIVTET